MRYYSYDEFKVDVNQLAKEIKPYKPDVILAIARGGMTLGHFLSEALEMRDLYSITRFTMKRHESLIRSIFSIFLI